MYLSREELYKIGLNRRIFFYDLTESLLALIPSEKLKDLGLQYCYANLYMVAFTMGIITQCEMQQAKCYYKSAWYSYIYEN